MDEDGRRAQLIAVLAARRSDQAEQAALAQLSEIFGFDCTPLADATDEQIQVLIDLLERELARAGRPVLRGHALTCGNWRACACWDCESVRRAEADARGAAEGACPICLIEHAPGIGSRPHVLANGEAPEVPYSAAVLAAIKEGQRTRGVKRP